jgi:hypothetical protein
MVYLLSSPGSHGSEWMDTRIAPARAFHRRDNKERVLNRAIQGSTTVRCVSCPEYVFLTVAAASLFTHDLDVMFDMRDVTTRMAIVPNAFFSSPSPSSSGFEPVRRQMYEKATIDYKQTLVF